MAHTYNITDFIAWALPHANNKIKGTYPIPYEEIATDPWWYLLGTSVIDCTDSIIKSHRANYKTWSDTEYYNTINPHKGQKVTDCQGLVDGYARMFLGVPETNAKGNYANWCVEKSNNMALMPKLIGVAVFMTDKTDKDSSIHHVGFICGCEANGQLLVIEARGLATGVVITRFADRGWNRWGKMDTIFSYGIYPIVETPDPFFAVCGGNGVNIRLSASLDAGVITTVNKGHKLLALPCVNKWCRVTYYNDDNCPLCGYMYSDYVDEV